MLIALGRSHRSSMRDKYTHLDVLCIEAGEFSAVVKTTKARRNTSELDRLRPTPFGLACDDGVPRSFSDKIAGHSIPFEGRPVTASNERLPLDRREFLSRGGMAIAATATAISLASRGFADLHEPSEHVEVSTAYGRLRGLRQPGLLTFLGVPYAGPVSGANRFVEAPALEPWTGVKDALQLGPPSPQPGKSYYGINEPSPAENCLFLNIWTPAADGRKRPVMVYSHGGGFYKGSGGAHYQDGGNLARTYDVVVVTTNHRLGLMGYLFLGDLGGEAYATSGNQGLLDIKGALKWVHESISSFGGDPNKVMIFGESGGALKTSALYGLPSAAPFFNKASIESGAGIFMMPRDVAAASTQLVLQHLGLTRNEWQKLLEIPLDQLIAAQVAVAAKVGPGFDLAALRKGKGWILNGGFAPVVDGTILPHDPFYPEAPAFSKNKPLMVGSNRDEMNFVWFQGKMNSIFSLTDETLKTTLHQQLGTEADTVLATYRKTRPHASPPDLYTAITTAAFFWLAGIRIAERKAAQQGAPVYMYMFVHQSNYVIPGTTHTIGAAHALEIPYKFGNIHPVGQESHADTMQPGSNISLDNLVGTDPDREKVARNMSEMWTTYARTGHPGAKGQPAWPAYTLETRATMQIDAQCKVIDDPFGEERKMWEQLDA
jgi:para-nitrobenzyl esterase